MSIPGFIVVIDSYLIRRGMVSVLNQIQGIRIVGEFSDADSFRRYAQRMGVEFLVISQSMFNLSSALFESNPGLLEKTILLKEEPSGNPKVHSSIYLSEGKDAITGKIKKLIDLYVSSDPFFISRELSQREKTIVRLVSLGLTNRQIADELFLSTHTVITHRKNITSKLGIKSVSGLTVYAIVNNIINIEEVTSKPSQ